jgi:hypothetical protein
MAYGFGSGVRAELGATDYSNYLRGALTGAQMQAQGGAAIGAGVQNALAGIGVGVQKFMKNKQEKIALQEATDIIVPLLGNSVVRSQFGIPENATDEDVSAAVKKQVKIFGAPAALELARQAQGSAAFQAGIGAVPDVVMETIEKQEYTAPKFAAGNIESFNGVSPFQSTPEQSVEELMPEGRLSPFLSAPDQPVEGLMLEGKVAPQVSTSEAEPKTFQAVPDNIAPYFSLNRQTGKLVPTKKLQVDAEKTSKAFQELELEKRSINSLLKTGKEKTVTGITRYFQPIVGYQELQGDTLKTYNQRLDEIEGQQAPLKEKLIELGNARQFAADFINKPEEKLSVEEKASEVIDRSISFAEEVNLDPVDKNQWLQMKTVLKEVPRKATDGEKIAAFVKAYSQIAPIDPGVYFKMKQAFGSAPVITDLGNGNQLVTANNQSFLIKNNEDKPLSVAQQKQNRELFYYDLLINSSKIGLEQLKNLHPQAFEELQKLHLSFGKTNPFTNMVIPLADSVSSLSELPASNSVAAGSLGGMRQAADAIVGIQ